MQESTSIFKSLNVVYDRLRKQATKEKCCPLCSRSLADQKNMDILVAKVEELLDKIPEKKAQADAALERL